MDRIRVSVVIPTYRTGEALDPLIACLDAQTMDPSAYEVIVVDDGSPDETEQRLRALARTRPWMAVHRIDNSGWPGRPRNVGIRAARGEYVFFMDHDDYAFPDALARMWQFAHDHDLDVLHPKEVVLGWHAPGWASWRAQSGRVSALDQAILQCITPHKLYRRQFLLDHDIWFREGRVRLEDFDFNGKVWSQTDRIGILADHPCYQWNIHSGNSHKAPFDLDSYWRDFTASLEAVREMPAGAKRDQLLVRWYRSRILGRLAAGFHELPEDLRERMRTIFRDQLASFPADLDRLLVPADRARSALLRRDDFEALRALSLQDAGLGLMSVGGRAWWAEGRLEVESVAVVADAKGVPLAVDLQGARYLRRLGPELTDRLTDDELDLTDDLTRAFGEVVVRSRTQAVDWILPTESSITVEPGSDGEPGRIVMRLRAGIDPATAAFGSPLDLDIHDLFHRLDGLGFTPTQRIASPPGFGAAALLDGRPAIAYTNANGFLSLDLASAARTPIGTSSPTQQDFTCDQDSAGTRITLTLPRLHVHGRTDLSGTALVGDTTTTAHLQTDDHTATARFSLPPQPPGLHPIRLQFFDRPTGVIGQLRVTHRRTYVVANGFRERSRLVPVGGRAWWAEGRLEVESVAVVADAKGVPLAVDLQGARYLRRLGPELTDRLTDDELDLTDDLTRAFGEVVVRSRTQAVDWILPTESSITVEPGSDGEPGRIVMRLRAGIDPATAAFGSPLDLDIHDLFHRLDGLGFTPTQRIASPPGFGAAALLDGRPAIAYTNANGFLSLDLASAARTPIGTSSPTQQDFTCDQDSAGTRITLTLPRLHVHGRTDLSGTALVGDTTTTAHLQTDDHTATARFSLPPQPPGLHPIRLQFFDRPTGVIGQLRVTHRRTHVVANGFRERSRLVVLAKWGTGLNHWLRRGSVR